MVIYADVLFTVNLAVDFLLLAAAHALTRIRISFIRTLIASTLGAASSFIILLPKIHIIISIIMKLGICAAMAVISNTAKGGRILLRLFCALFSSTLILCGIMTALAALVLPQSIGVNNLCFYVDLSPLVLILSSAGLYIIIKLFSRIFASRRGGEMYELTLCYNNKTIECVAKHDTGCEITDPYTGGDVFIIDAASARALTGRDIDINCADVKPRLIPCKTVGGGKMLPSFTVKWAKIGKNGHYFAPSGPTVAVSDDFGGDYNALVGSSIIDNISGRQK